MLATPVLYRSGGIVSVSPSISSARINPISSRRCAVSNNVRTMLRNGSGLAGAFDLFGLLPFRILLGAGVAASGYRPLIDFGLGPGSFRGHSALPVDP